MLSVRFLSLGLLLSIQKLLLLFLLVPCCIVWVHRRDALFLTDGLVFSPFFTLRPWSFHGFNDWVGVRV